MAKLQLPVPEEPIVVLGQVPHDMALVETPGLKYNDWLDAMFRNNLDTFFLFKHHPLAKTTLPLENYSNVMVINENIASLWAAFDHFAAYSSTTIFEGMDRGKKFATGGYHFCSGLTLQINTADGMKNLMEQLRAYEIPEEAWMRRQTFMCNHYSVPMSSPRLWDRMTMPSQKFFGG
jgi:capsule polysaccharide export protein KpsC/LpsZ